MAPQISRESLREELGNNLQIGLGTGLIGGGLLGFLAAAATLALNPALFRATGDAIHLVLGLQFVYAVLCLVLGFLAAGAKTAVFLTTGRRVSDTKTAALAPGIAFFLLGTLYSFSWCRWHNIGGLAAGHPIGIRQIPVLLAILAVGLLLARAVSYAFYVLIVYVKKPELRKPGDVRRVFLTLVYMTTLFVLFIAVMRVTAGTSATTVSGLTGDSLNPAGRRVLLLGVDGLNREDIALLRGEGLLAWSDPLLAGALAPIETPADAVPPMIWTVIATGKDLSRTGVVGYQAQMVKGLSTPLQIGPNQVGLFELFHSVLPVFHLTRTVPFKSYMREAKGLWNMASEAGRKSVVVNWWISWPAERVRGVIVSDHAWLKLTGAGDAGGLEASDPEAAARTAARIASSVQTPGRGMTGAMVPLRPDGKPLFLERETWPPTLLIELGTFAGSSLPDTVAARYGALPSPGALAAFGRLGIPADVLRSDLFYAQSAAWLLDREEPDLWMLHLPGPDVIRRVLEKRISDPRAREVARQEALALYWGALDAPLRAIVAHATAGSAAGGASGIAGGTPATTASRDAAPGAAKPVELMWTCLPGFRWTDAPARDQAGLFSLTGAGEKPGPLGTPVRPAEIAPTALWLLGLPAAEDLDGRPRTDPLTAEGAAPLVPVRTIQSYGRAATRDLERAASTLDQEMLERFKSLGYIR